MNFSYVALDPAGKEQQGFVEADSQSLAITLIKEKGLFPTNVVEAGAQVGKSGKKGRKKGKVVSSGQKKG